MTAERSKNGAIASSSINFSGYIGHTAIWLNAYYCMLFSTTARIRIRFSGWLVSGYERVFILLSVVIVTLLWQ